MAVKNEPWRQVAAKHRWRPEFDVIEFETPDQIGRDEDALLHYATFSGPIEDVACLLDAGAKIDACGDLRHTALHYAAMRGRKDVVALLLERGANTRLENEWGATALDLAQNAAFADIVRLLKKET